jgi:dTDP-4-amino-4,6-dideoxygalactose transaminase
METLAILGGEPVRKTPFPAWPQWDDSERRALLEVLESGVWWRSPGTHTLTFEREFAAYHGARHGIACTNGTAAIEIAMAGLGIGLGDEVIIPNYTFVATASAVLFAGALPVTVDIDPHTYCIDPDCVEAVITQRTRAVIAVHLAGHPADLDRLLEITRRRGLYLVEDCAHAHGSEWKGRKVGSFGDAGAFSFQQSKLMTAGEGGIVITNDDDLERRMRSIHDCGRLPGEWYYSHFMYGSNYRMSEWQGAVLSQQLRRLDEQAAVRSRNAACLNRALAGIDGITPQALDPRCTRNGHYCYVFHYNRAAFAGLPAAEFIRALEAEGIPTQSSYPSVNLLDVFQSGVYRDRLSFDHITEHHAFLSASYPRTQRAAAETVWLVHRALMGSEDDTAQIVEAVKKIQRHAAVLVKHPSPEP